MQWNIFWGAFVLMVALFLSLVLVGGAVKPYRGRHRAPGAPNYGRRNTNGD